MADLEIFADGLQHFKPIHFGHHLIGHHNIRMIQMYFLQTFHSVISNMDIKLVFQLKLYQLAKVFVIFHQQKGR